MLWFDCYYVYGCLEYIQSSQWDSPVSQLAKTANNVVQFSLNCTLCKVLRACHIFSESQSH